MRISPPRLVIATLYVFDINFTFSSKLPNSATACSIIVVLLLSGLIARETKHYVWDKNLEETDETPIPVLESK